MPRIQCTNCGKVIEVRPDDGGAIFVCVACGTRIESPMVGEDATAWTALRTSVEKDVQKWKGIAPPNADPETYAVAKLAAILPPPIVEVAEEEEAPAISTLAPRTSHFGSPLGWALAVVLVALAIVLPFVILKLNEPKKADYSDLVLMQRKAESLAAAGDLPAAHEAYGVLFEKANERAVDDPLVLERLAKAKRDEERVAKILN